MRRVLALLVLLVVVAVPVWLVLGSDPSGPRDDTAPPPEDTAAAPERSHVAREERGAPAADTPVQGDCALVVRVTLDGAPAAGAAVSVRSAPNPAQLGPFWQDYRPDAWRTVLEDPPVARAEAGPDGVARIGDLPAGTWHVLAEVESGARAATRATIVADGQALDVEVAIRTGAYALQGRITGPDGEPFTGRLFLASTSDAAVHATDARDGEFRFEGLATGRHHVRVHVPGRLAWMTGPIDVPHDGPLSLSMAGDGTRLRGRVTADRGGAPVAGAGVAVRALFPGALATLVTETVTADDGTFEAPCGGRASVAVTAPGFAPCAVWLNAPAEDDAPLEIVLAAAGSVSGRVIRAADGEPQAGVRVQVRAGPRTMRILPALDVVSAADGSFAMEGLAPGEYDVFAVGGGWASAELADASVPGYLPFRVPVDGNAVEGVVLRLVPTGSLACRVTEAGGMPVAGAVVTATPMQWTLGWPIPRAAAVLTDDGGTARVADLPVGIRHTLTARVADGRVASGRAAAAVEPDGAPLELTLDPLRTLLVRVVEQGGGPVPGARVSASGGHSTVVTDAEGVATVCPAPSGRVSISVIAGGREGRGSTSPPDDPQEPWEAEVTVPPGRDVAGRVLAPDGSPAAGIEVEGHAATGPGLGRLFVRGARVRVTSDADGTFVLRGMPDSSVAVRADGKVGGAPHAATAEVAPDAADVELLLAPVPEPGEREDVLPVRIVGPDGAPVHSVRCSMERRSGSGSSRSTYTVERGRCAVGIDTDPDSANTLEIREPRDVLGRLLPYAGVRRDVPPDTRGELEIRLEPEWTIEGRVTDADGLPVAGAVVDAYAARSAEDDGALPRGSRDTSGTAVTDRDGRYRVGQLAEGDHVVVVHAPPGLVRPPTARVPSGERHDVVLALAQRVTVRVVDPDGSPAAGVGVRVTAGEATVASERTDAAGEAVLDRIEPGSRYTLALVPDRDTPLLQKEVPDWFPADATFTLERSLAIRGIVVDEDGRPLPSAMVWRQTSASSWNGSQAERDGTFVRDGLRAGEALTLRAEVGDVYSEPQEVTAGTGDVRLVVTIGPRIVVSVPGAVSTHVYAVGEDGRKHARTDVDGRALFPRLVAGDRYTLLVGPTPDGRYAAREGVVPGPATVELTLRPGETIAGRIEAPPGLASSTIRARGPHGLETRQRTAHDGTFRLQGLAPGTWELRARRREGDVTYAGHVTATTGEDDVVLRLQAE